MKAVYSRREESKVQENVIWQNQRQEMVVRQVGEQAGAGSSSLPSHSHPGGRMERQRIPAECRVPPEEKHRWQRKMQAGAECRGAE